MWTEYAITFSADVLAPIGDRQSADIILTGELDMFTSSRYQWFVSPLWNKQFHAKYDPCQNNQPSRIGW